MVTLATQGQDHWPMEFTTPDGTTEITVFLPQPETYENGYLTARAAVAISKLHEATVYGAVWATGLLEVDRDTRMGVLTLLTVTDAKFPTIEDEAKVLALKQLLSEEIPKYTQPLYIDRLVASLEERQTRKPALRNDPPRIFVEQEYAALVIIDGEPIYRSNEGTDYERVVNTPYTILRRRGTELHFLTSGSLWYTAGSVQGPWSHMPVPPADLVPPPPPPPPAPVEPPPPAKKTSRRSAERYAPAVTPGPVAPLSTPERIIEQPPEPLLDENGVPIIPKVIISTVPAELLQTVGAPAFSPIDGTMLLYVSNSENYIFMELGSQRYYVLLSGRWFTNATLGPEGWTYVEAEKLPPDFALIPEDSEMGDVLPSVPGTQAAREAVLDASIPQTAQVQRSATTTIEYDGEPQFANIPGTIVSEALNASATVLRINGRFHACDGGVWYDSNSATGPWQVSTAVPKEVMDIPPSSPSYNVRFAEIYGSTPEVVYVGYTPGYTGSFVYGTTVVYGTGFVYQPWVGVVYVARPVTFGFRMHYSPFWGWSMGVGWGMGMGMGMHMGMGWSMHMRWGMGGWWGPPMHRPPMRMHGPGMRTSVNPNRVNGNMNGSRSQGNLGYVNRNRMPSTGGQGGQSLYNNQGRPGVQSSQRPGAAPGQYRNPNTRPTGGSAPKGGGYNNLMSDRQGNVYRNTGANDYRQQGRPAGGQGGARPQTPNNTTQQLNRDAQSRDRGQQRVNNYNRQSSGGMQQGRPSTGGSMQSRPSAPSQSRPSGGSMQSRPAGGGARPSGGSMSRPSGGRR